jgi:phytoene dehydrogenase-like protein
LTPQNYDAVVIGAGHNGLVCAAYLAAAGLETLVVERRDKVGGAAVTEEFAPGYRASTASYSLSLFRPDIHRDLGLARRGLRIIPKEPQMFVPLPDSSHFFIWRDEARTIDELRRISEKDADAYRSWNAFLERATRLLRPVIEEPNPPTLAELEDFLRRNGNDEVWEKAVAGSVAETVSKFFEHEGVQGAFASQGIIGTNLSPYEPGTAWVMTYHSLGGELCGMDGTWGYVVGGMGGLTDVLREAALAVGAEVITGVEVEQVIMEEGRAVGVATPDGEFRSETVISNADPKRTFQKLLPQEVIPEELLERVNSWRMDGCVVKVNLALSELPDFTAFPGDSVGPQHSGTVDISPSIAYLDSAYDDARRGSYSSTPFCEVYMQSAVDSSLTESGHVLSAFTQYAPQLGTQEWERERASVEKTVVSTLASYAPNLESAVVASQVLGPLDLGERFGLTGGDIFHGSILPDQSFAARFDYRTPIAGLYLCGSGARPGGGVMGAAGRNAARAVLADRGRDT